MDIHLRRIMIFGRPGSGKSTFAYKLHQTLQIPVFHLDKHFYQLNWLERPTQEFLSIQQSIVNKESWIIDSNSTKSLEMRYSRADMVLYFNYPRWKCYVRILKRLFYKDPAIDDRAVGCHEIIRFKLLWYTWNFEERVTQKIDFLKKKYPHIPFIEIKNNRQLERFLEKTKIPSSG